MSAVSGLHSQVLSQQWNPGICILSRASAIPIHVSPQHSEKSGLTVELGQEHIPVGRAGFPCEWNGVALPTSSWAGQEGYPQTGELGCSFPLGLVFLGLDSKEPKRAWTLSWSMREAGLRSVEVGWRLGRKVSRGWYPMSVTNYPRASSKLWTSEL